MNSQNDVLADARAVVAKCGQDVLTAKAWEIYCRETAGSMDVRDHWSELSPRVQAIFLKKAATDKRNKIVLTDQERDPRNWDCWYSLTQRQRDEYTKRFHESEPYIERILVLEKELASIKREMNEHDIWGLCVPNTDIERRAQHVGFYDTWVPSALDC